MKLAVGFLTYNEASAKYLEEFLPSLSRALGFLSPDDYKIYVHDNSSSDDRRNQTIITGFRTLTDCSPFIYSTTSRNLGFSRAYNSLIASAIKDSASYFLVINPDTLLDEGAIQKLVAALDNNASLASVAPKILSWDFTNHLKTDTIDSLGLILKPGLKFSDLGQGLKDEGQFDQAKIIGPSGAAGMFRLSALEKVATPGEREGAKQYFDEHFFMYKEDCDLAYRLFLAGYQSALIPESLVYHDRTAASTGPGVGAILRDRRQKSRQIRAWSFKNQHLIFIKYWKQQNLANKVLICYHLAIMFIFSLILEQFLFKQYYSILKSIRGLTNVK